MKNQKIRTDADLARALGVNRQLISAWRQKADSPKGHNLEEWQTYLLQTARLPAKFTEQDRLELGRLKIRLLRAQTERIERENTVRSGELLDKSAVGESIVQGFGAMFSELDQALLRDAPQRLAGLEAKGIHLVLQNVLAGAHESCRVALAKLGGEAVPDYERKPFIQYQVDAELYQKAFRDGCSSTWMEFCKWREHDAAARGEVRRQWCQSRAAANEPVYDASPEELAATPGLRRV